MCYFLKAGGYRISIMIIISSSHLHLHPQSVLYFLNIKYDIPVCHEGYEGHEGHEVYDGHIYIYIYKLTERIVVLLNAILKSEI